MSKFYDDNKELIDFAAYATVGTIVTVVVLRNLTNLADSGVAVAQAKASVAASDAEQYTAAVKADCLAACEQTADTYLEDERFGASWFKSDLTVWNEVYTTCAASC